MACADLEPAASVQALDDMVQIPGGTFRMGSDAHYPEEAPAHLVKISAFEIDRMPVTNAVFARFVAATGYATVAERAPRAEDYPDALPEQLTPGSLVFKPPARLHDPDDWTQWWRYEPGACWRAPAGPASSVEGREDHPVVHIAFDDAAAFAAWAGKDLPSEAEWEFAARGGLEGAEFAWGDELTPGGRHMANVWQGEFPCGNTGEDSFVTTSPVGTYPPNGYGLFDMIGNVWEWTSDYWRSRHPADPAKACCVPTDPRGGAREGSFDTAWPAVTIPRRVLKGGSHLCAPSYCRRYRPAARHAETVDTSTSHIGFRCVRRIGNRT